MLHSGVMLKMGAYGLIRFGVELFPGYVTDLAFFIGVLGVVNILYGALLAFVQTDLNKSSPIPASVTWGSSFSALQR